MLTFALHQRLPYKRLLIITGVMLLFVLIVAVGEEVNEMQLAGWIGTTEISWLHIPGWMGTWFSLFNNWETFAGQFLAISLVVGSYFGCAVRACVASSPSRPAGREARRAAARGFRRHRRRRAAPQPLLRLAPGPSRRGGTFKGGISRLSHPTSGGQRAKAYRRQPKGLGAHIGS